MDLERQDKVCDVTAKLKTLNDFFQFYDCGGYKAGFREGSIVGLCMIINDCIAELEEAVGTESE